jgi:hypothetical protein
MDGAASNVAECQLIVDIQILNELQTHFVWATVVCMKSRA